MKKTEDRLGIYVKGYMKKAEFLQGEIDTLRESLVFFSTFNHVICSQSLRYFAHLLFLFLFPQERSEVELRSFQKLSEGELFAVGRRKKELAQLVQESEGREALLQQKYAALLRQKDFLLSKLP